MAVTGMFSDDFAASYRDAFRPAAPPHATMAAKSRLQKARLQACCHAGGRTHGLPTPGKNRCPIHDAAHAVEILPRELDVWAAKRTTDFSQQMRLPIPGRRAGGHEKRQGRCNDGDVAGMAA